MTTIYRTNEYEWWVGNDWDSLRTAILHETRLTEAEAFQNPRALTDDELDTMTRVDDTGHVMTFREALADDLERGIDVPYTFACTEGI